VRGNGHSVTSIGFYSELAIIMSKIQVMCILYSYIHAQHTRATVDQCELHG